MNHAACLHLLGSLISFNAIAIFSRQTLYVFCLVYA